MDETELEKQALERRQRHIEAKERIKAQPAIKSWTEVSPHAGWVGYSIIFVLWLLVTIPFTLSDHFTFWEVGPIFALFAGVTGGSVFLIGTKYQYHITEEGFYADYQRNFPEWSLSIVRGIGVFGVVVCCVLAFFYGPALFIGAGASALGAFALVNYKEPVDSQAGLKSQVEKAFIFKKGRMLRLKGRRDKALSRTNFPLYFAKDSFDSEVEEILAMLPDDIEVIEIQKLNDMYTNRAKHKA